MKYTALFILTLTGMWACKPKPKAGLGGSNTLVVFPQHHSRPINNCTVFIKFNTQDSPGTDTNAYDTKFKGDLHTDHTICSGLKQGQYYIYAYGWDTLINQHVHGGLPLDLTSTSGTTNFTLPISEE